MDALKRHGRVVYLHRAIDYLEERADDDESARRSPAPRSFRQIMKRREPWYRRAADHVIECGERAKGRDRARGPRLVLPRPEAQAS